VAGDFRPLDRWFPAEDRSSRGAGSPLEFLRKGPAVSSSVLASGAGTYVHWGVLQISVTNLLIIGVMLLLFVLAIVLPFPGNRGRQGSERQR
jgi:hypothetical protein